MSASAIDPNTIPAPMRSMDRASQIGSRNTNERAMATSHSRSSQRQRKRTSAFYTTPGAFIP